MLIGIDASRAVKNQPTGTEYYSREIIKALARIDQRNFYLLYSPTKPKGELAHLPARFIWKIIPFPRLWSQVRLSWELLTTKARPDIVFEPAHTIPVIHPVPMVITIHDLGFKHHPELYTRFENFYHNFSARFSARHANQIIAVSNFTARDILKSYSLRPDKVDVIYHGVDKSLFRPASLKEKKQPLPSGISRPYIFYIGRLEHKKNIVSLLKAYQILREEKKVRHRLVLAGRPGFGYDKIKKTIDDLSPAVAQDVIETGYISQKDYSQILKNADIFAFPSNFEGFGMPVIEAMASGVPVVCSDRTSLPEIAGNAALLIDPKKPFEMAVAFSKIINKPAIRNSLISKGLKRSMFFSWERTAQKTLAILEKAGRNNQKYG
jgi:glycosyltransferase involved in cell wall biosynthesis